MSEAYIVVPLSPLRRAIASRMTEAKQTVPHYRVGVDVEMDALLALRAQVNAGRAESERVSVNDSIVKACAGALMRHPGVNAQLVGGEIHQYHAADISVVMAVPGGLSTPVVRGAERKTVWEIGAEVRSLASRAAVGRLKMEEIAGGSFSVSNLGGYGVDQFDAIINVPQVAILAVGRARRQVVVDGNGEMRVASVMRATLSVDHRAVDGVGAAEFLGTLRTMLEEPSTLFGAAEGA